MHVEDFSNFKFDDFSEPKKQEDDDTVRVEDITNPSNIITLYHGTKEINFKPDFRFNNPNNDYGRGLYLTPELDKGLEWAMSSYHGEGDGYVYEYRFDTTGLNILQLNRKDVVEWVVVLLQNRKYKDIDEDDLDTIKDLLSKYHVDLNGYDAIYGYRADDTYFSHVRKFISGKMNTGGLKIALESGKLGMQYCLKTEKAFDRLEFISRCKASEADRIRFNKREESADKRIASLSKEIRKSGKSVSDIINGR